MSQFALIVSEEGSDISPVRSSLVEQGFRVDDARDAESALGLAPAVDLVVLDLAVEETDAFELCRKLRGATDAYIVAMGEEESELDLVLSLSVGADDFVAKPVRRAELVARVRALLRRPRSLASSSSSLRVADLEIDLGAREVLVGGEAVELSNLEFDLLATLARNPNLTLSRRQLLGQVWGPNWFGDDHVIDVHISNLRRKLGDDAHTPRYIRTVRGFGFRIAARAVA